MIIQFNTDHSIKGIKKLKAPLEAVMTSGSDKTYSKITQLEVYLSGEDSNTDGQNDKLCKIEARLEGMNPIAVSSNANTHEQAVEGAMHMLKHSLDARLSV